MYEDQDDDMLIISGARQKQDTNVKLSNVIPELQSMFDINSFEKYVLNQDYDEYQIQELIANCNLDTIKLRFSLWRLYLKLYKKEDIFQEKIHKLNLKREEYREFTKQVQNNESKGNKKNVKNNPLANKTKENTIWNNFFEINQLKTDVKKDVERTHQDQPLFNCLKVRTLLHNILFNWSIKNPSISYRQGMNEVAANVIIVYYQEIQGIQKYLQQFPNYEHKEQLLEFMNEQYAEEDIFCLFEQILTQAGHMEMFRPDDKSKNSQIKLKTNSILYRIQQIQDVTLQLVDKQLFLHFKLINVELQIFLLRWIRCIFTREFHLSDSFKVWDAIFYDYYASEGSQQLDLIDTIVLSMIMYVRQYALENDDQSRCLKRFLKYPPIEDLSLLIKCALSIKKVLCSKNIEAAIKEEEALQKILGKHSEVQEQQQIVYQPKNDLTNSPSKSCNNSANNKMISIPQSKLESMVLVLENGVRSIENNEKTEILSFKDELVKFKKYLVYQIEQEKYNEMK